MGGFFAKGGNGQGFFPDTSIEEEKSLFTNDDERNSLCPCSIADGEIIPINPPTVCNLTEPVIQDVTPDDFVP